MRILQVIQHTSDFPVPVDPRMTTRGSEGGLRADIVEAHRRDVTDNRRAKLTACVMDVFTFAGLSGDGA